MSPERRVLLAALAIGLAMAVGQLLVEHVLTIESPSEEAYLDRLFRSRENAAAPGSEEVMLISFDKATFQALNATFSDLTPHLTRLIQALREGGAKVIGLDIGVASLEQGPGGPEFLETCAKAGNVVFSSVIAKESPDEAPVSHKVQVAVARAEVPTGFSNFTVAASPRVNRANRGNVRRLVSLDAKLGARTAHSFALELARRARGLARDKVVIEPSSLRLGDRVVPLEDGMLRVDYPGPTFFATLPMERLIGENETIRKISMRAVSGKIVLVGSFMRALADVHPTPFGNRPGVTLHAAIVRTLLAGRPPRPAPAWAGPLLALATALFVGGLFARFKKLRALAVSLALPLAWHVVAYSAFDGGVWIPAAFALLTGPITGVALWGLDLRRPAPIIVQAGFEGETVAGDSQRPDWGEGDLVLRIARQVVSTHYRDVELLGRGGMGVVLRAYDPKRGESVAVKILSPLLSDRPALVARFMREIKALQTVAHPGIVAIFDVQETGENPWYSMELVDGIDLKAYLRDRGTFELAAARDVFGQLFDVVGHIHGHGVIHRDLKPDNILLTPEGRVKVLDFGLAHVPEASTLTQDGEVMGTLRYMSPEQMDGAELTPASDVFSCALVAFEAMSGRMPFPEMGRLLHYTGTMTSLESLLPGTPPGLSDLFMRCLSPRADLRPSDASKLAREWARVWGAMDATLPPRFS